MNIVAIIEARMASTRLPGKVLLPVLGEPILAHLVNRLKQVSLLTNIVIATTTNSIDDLIIDFAKKNNINSFRGSEENVMQRVLCAAKYYDADIIVEITGDCPIIDPEIVEQVILTYLNNTVDYVSNSNKRSYPDGMDVQVFSYDTLKKSYELTQDILDYEHVTLHIRNNPKFFTKINLIAPKTLYWPDLGLTLDEQKDYELLKIIIEHFDDYSQFFTCKEVIDFLKINPNLLTINNNVARKGDT